MTIDIIRHLYEYHFSLNRKMWDYSIENLKWDQIVEEINISHGSIRNIFVHIMGVDERWFSGFRRVEDPGFPDPLEYANPELIRAKWDTVEEQMKTVLLILSDDELEGTFQGDMKNWQVLLHVVNHGTHHRAQLGDIFRHHGLKPVPQDYIFYAMGRV